MFDSLPVKVWRPQGGEPFYRCGNKVIAVDVQVGQAFLPAASGQVGDLSPPGFSAGNPTVLFEGPYLMAPAAFPNYDVSPDVQRFLMLKFGEAQQASTQIIMRLGWCKTGPP
ncbi:MAG: hypothetical protein EXQ56_02795 [Acidobacteria bacterium]|nr:hypothetical protein [Acidobacteriota bacterium]